MYKTVLLCVLLGFAHISALASDSDPQIRIHISPVDGQEIVAEQIGIGVGVEIMELFHESSVISYSYIPFVSDHGKYGVRDSKGKICIDAKYEEIIPSTDMHVNAFWARENQKWMLLDVRGGPLSSIQFEEIRQLYEGKAVVKFSGKWGCINARGEWILPPKYDFTDTQVREGVLAYQAHGKWGYVQMDGTILCNPVFDAASGFSGGVAVVQKGDKCAVIKRDMSYLTDYLYEYAFRPSDGLIPVCMYGKWGYINDVTGESIIPCKYSFAIRFRRGIGYVLDVNTWKIVYSNGILGGDAFDSEDSLKGVKGAFQRHLLKLFGSDD